MILKLPPRGKPFCRHNPAGHRPDGVRLFGNAILPRRKHNMRKLLLWLVMVAVMIAAILGGTAAFLYSRTGTDALPQEAVTFGEQTLEPNGWSWVIPVLGDKVNKTYESPTNLTVQKLGTFTDTVPQLVLPDWVTAAELQITAPDGTVWTGALADCNTYTYTQNGDYQIIVTAHHSSADNPGDPWLVRLPRRLHNGDEPQGHPEHRARAAGQHRGCAAVRYSGRRSEPGDRSGHCLVPQDRQRLHGYIP